VAENIHRSSQFRCGNHAASPHATATVVTKPRTRHRMASRTNRMETVYQHERKIVMLSPGWPAVTDTHSRTPGTVDQT